MKLNSLSGVLSKLALFGLLLAGPALRADNEAASQHFQKASEYRTAGKLIEAAEKFSEAELAADSPELKVQAAQEEAACYKAAGYYGKEFEALEKILEKYPTMVDPAPLVEREFAIGNAYSHGYRDPAFWSLRFIPWLTDKSKAKEVYDAALKRAPFAKLGGEARLQLAILALHENRNDDALKLLREIIQYDPDSEYGRAAMLELGNALTQLADAGDGDGRCFEEAMNVFQEFRKRYPDLSENEWINTCETKARAAYAKRLANIAEYYRSEGRTQPAEVYFLEVLRRFPETEAAIQSEKALTEMDKNFFPERIEPEVADPYPAYDKLAFPKEEHPLILAPGNSDNRFLLPIRDLNLPKNQQEKTK